MIIIAHRGNTHGPSEKENSPNHIDAALALGYDAEVDVWWVENVLYLGHDSPTYAIDQDWLISRKDKLWCHAKTVNAMSKLISMDMHWFWHDKDDYTLTSKGVVWAYPGKPPCCYDTIAVMPETCAPYDLSNFYGICTDYADLAK